MKLRSVGILAALFIMTLSMAMAWPKSKKTINLFEPTTVGSVTLRAGEYTIDWNGTGPERPGQFLTWKQDDCDSPSDA